MSKNQLTQEEALGEKLNREMAMLNSLIIGENKNSPAIHFESTKSYTFSTFDDHGTGTDYKGLIMFDVACLNLTEPPFLIHDSFLFKNIGKDTIKTIENYRDAGYQIFISIDNVKNYHQ